MKKTTYLTVVFWLFICLNLRAQEVTVSGKVTDQAGEALPGVNVTLEGTTQGTVTDVEGNYSISIPGDVEEPILVFSMVGMANQEIPVQGRSTIDVTMEEAVAELDEVVVVGYGQQQKRDVTGSISSVSAEDMANISAPSLENALQGQAAGVQMTSGGGSPVSQSRIMVRGLSSISSGSEPLIVIDGMPVSGAHESAGGSSQSINPLSLVNPSDIASIEVLKDAAATSIYGSRGSNGVVLITTKSGVGVEGELDVNYRTGITEPVNMFDFVGTDQWFDLTDLARANNPNDLEPFDPITDRSYGVGEPGITREDAMNVDNFWLDMITRQGNYQDVNVSSRGGSENSNYFISANYRTEKGFLKENDVDRLVTRINLDFSPLESLDLGTRTNLSFLKQQQVPITGGGPGGNRGAARGNWSTGVGVPPWYPVRYENSPFEFFDKFSGNNLMTTLYRDWHDERSTAYRGLSKFFADYTLPFFENITIHGEASIDFNRSTNIRYYKADIRPDSTAFVEQDEPQELRYNINAYATYNQTFGDRHNVKYTLGTETYSISPYSAFLSAENPTDESYPGFITDIQRGSFGRNEETRFRSWFTRLNYNFEQKYYFQFSFRRDGSTKFGELNRFGNFPAISAGWNIADEAFMDGLDFINRLKLRGSYGETGNASISSQAIIDDYAGWKRYGNIQEGYYLNRLGNPSITWETTQSTDVGFDFGLFENRVDGSVAWFNQDVSGLLLQAPISESNGSQSESIWANIGDIRNYGVEFNINSVNIDRGDFQWRTKLNLTLNSNGVESLTPNIARNNSGIIEGNTNTRTGERIGAYFMAKSAGINEDTGYEMIHAVDNDAFLRDDDDNYVDRQGNQVDPDNRVKNPNYLQIIPDSTLAATETNVSNNRTLMGDKTGMPTYFGGITNTFNYKGFSLSATFSFQGGNYIYDNVIQSTTSPTSSGGNIRTDYVGNYWTENNKDAKYPKPSWNNEYEVNGEIRAFSSETSRYLYKGDFIRLRNLRIGYSLPQDLMNTLSIKGLQVYVQGNNMWTITDYPGLDPEVTSFAGAQQRNLNPASVGSSFTPPLKRYTLGVNVKF